MKRAPLILVQGLYLSPGRRSSQRLSRAFGARSEAVAQHGENHGVLGYEQIGGLDKAVANLLLRLARGTAPAVDAVELFEIDEEVLQRTLARQAGRSAWQQMAGCAGHGFDVERSFFLIGKERLLVDGPIAGQRVLWFGRGLDSIGEEEFFAHYTGHHGPLVAGNAAVLGIRRYRQVAKDRDDLCEPLREVGLGQSPPPPVFAELAMAPPPFDLASLRARRRATRDIKADEKRHIDFRRSMLLLV